MDFNIGDIIHGLLREQAAQQPEQTVDKLLYGDAAATVTGIVTAFSASQPVIERALQLGCNLVISHEGVFYSHHDTRYGAVDDPIYAQKLALIQQSGIGIFRCHDYIHRMRPDGITAGLLQALNWQTHVETELPEAAILKLPGKTVREVADHVKRTLQLPYVRVAGDLSSVCRRIGVLVGYRGGGATAIPLFHNERLDLIIAGEGPEWETPEYVQDAVSMGHHRALIMLGHAESEMTGMLRLANLLSARYPELPVHFIANRPVFQTL